MSKVFIVDRRETSGSASSLGRTRRVSRVVGRRFYELEVGAYVVSGGSNWSAEEAADHIAGLTHFNDISARAASSKEK